jgi:translation initiation factor IF-2
MNGIRINELGRELEVKSKKILEYLPEIGLTEKKSHSSSLPDEIANKVRDHFQAVEKAEEEEAQKEAEAKAAAKKAAAERIAAQKVAAQRAAVERAAQEAPSKLPSLGAPVVPGTASTTPPARRAPAPGGARTIAQPTAVAPPPPVPEVPGAPPPPAETPAAAATAATAPATEAPAHAAPRARLRPRPMVSTAPAVPEPGKPIYERKKPPARRRPSGPAQLDKKAAEGERRLRHPVRPRVKREREERRVPTPRREAPVVQRGHIDITVTEGITVKELAEKLEVRAKDVIKSLLNRGILATINQSLDTKLASELAELFKASASVLSFEEESLKDVLKEEEVPGKRQERAPVVTVMGHVDHGKTSLLDAIRETDVIAQEAGGITQHIGAYQVEVDGRKITFIDTPGHEAFTRMRARGAKVTDLVVLVVAADDGVMPQTLEAIDHAKAGNVPLLVAINKIDKPDAMADRVKKQLADRGLMPEDWGGNTVMVEVSAKKKTNLNQLLEMVLLVSDMRELKANAGLPATGAVLESRLDRGRGPVATVLVQDGTLRMGDPFIVGPIFGKVRAMFDDHGTRIKEAGPAAPVEVLGLAALPEAGDQFQVVADEVKAKQVASYREQRQREVALGAGARLTLDQLHEQLEAGEVKELPLVLKADVQGSVEALGDQLEKLSNEKVRIKIIHSGVGGISENDVLLATASNAIIIGFNVRPERKAADVAQQEGIEIRHHSVIYEVIEEMEKAMAGLLEPTLKETILGRAEVRDTFRIPRVGMVAGCYVVDGKVQRDADVRVLRDNVVIYQSKVASLRRFKDDVKEVASGYECGLTVANFADIKVGDLIEVFAVEKVPSTVSA